MIARQEEIIIETTPDLLLRAYAHGMFPMAESANDPALYWIEPERRGVIPLDDFHLPKRLARTVRSQIFEIRVDHDFDAVIDGCAAPAQGRRKTWINQPIRDLYGALFEMGHCHTVEAYREGKLVGGLYGVTLNSAFFGESMFHTERDASKVALVHLVARLKEGGFTLLDTQFITSHLARFGALEIDRHAYERKLRAAMKVDADFNKIGAQPPVSLVLQSVSQTSNTGCSTA